MQELAGEKPETLRPERSHLAGTAAPTWKRSVLHLQLSTKATNVSLSAWEH